MDLFLQMYFDDLPVWAFIGKFEKAKESTDQTLTSKRCYLYTHYHFDIHFNRDRVIELNISTVSNDLRSVDITDDEPKSVRFTYSVNWSESSVPFSDRMDRYSKHSFDPQHLEVWTGFILDRTKYCIRCLHDLLASFLSIIFYNTFNQHISIRSTL